MFNWLFFPELDLLLELFKHDFYRPDAIPVAQLKVSINEGSLAIVIVIIIITIIVIIFIIVVVVVVVVVVSVIIVNELNNLAK